MDHLEIARKDLDKRKQKPAKDLKIGGRRSQGTHKVAGGGQQARP